MSNRIIYNHGLTTRVPLNLRCDRCDSSLENSLWEGKLVVYSTNKQERGGFLCVRCILNPQQDSRKFGNIEEELEEFLEIEGKKTKLEPVKSNPKWKSYRCARHYHSECKGIGVFNRKICTCDCHSERGN